jgi:hypothetical protein
MNKSFAVVLGLVGAVSAVVGASPAMANSKATGVILPGGTATGTVLATAPGNSVAYKLSIAAPFTSALSATLALTPTGFTVQQSLVSITCNTGTASTYSVGTGNINIVCPPLSTTVTNAEALISVN